ncbi:MAG: hypothetical protein K9L98_02325 [Candidatus Pacebacteria bacterium]|nr:hypothetical protein [Candidatus Paceibacterota bacterium]MCF7862822.1 hypothetical protein [Candidatus Paceibacterota bacterium]
MMMDSKIIKVVLTCVAVAVLAFGVWYLVTTKSTINDSVEVVSIEDLKDSTDDIQKVNFQYPEKLSAQNIFLVDWPPKIVVMNVPFVCKPSEDSGVFSKNINGKEYCVRVSAEETALSLYTYYSYAFEKEGRSLNMTFSVRENKCEAVETKEDKNLCEVEKNSFDLEKMIQDIVATISFVANQ